MSAITERGFCLSSYSSHFSLTTPYTPPPDTGRLRSAKHAARWGRGAGGHTGATPRYIYRIGAPVAQQYKAAGVLVVARDPSNYRLMMLLGREDRTKRVGKHRTPLGYFWLHFQGKREREDCDDPRLTAMRELEEETGGILAAYRDYIRDQLYEHTTPKLWYKMSKYVLFVVNIPFDRSLPLQFANVEREQCKDLWQDAIQWVPISQLYRTADAPRSACKPQTRCSGLDEPLYPFFCTLLRLPGTRKLIRDVSAGTPVHACDMLKDWRRKDTSPPARSTGDKDSESSD